MDKRARRINTKYCIFVPKFITMKKLILTTSIIGLLTSCSTTGFLKRKYTKGLYIEHFTSQIRSKKQPHISNVLVNPTPSEQKITERTPNNNLSSPKITNTHIPFFAKNNPPDPLENNQTLLTHTQKNSLTCSKNLHPKSYAYSDKYTPIQWLPSTFFTLKDKKQTYKPSDNDKIIQIILALFPVLCLIAIYLHDGKKITINFIIDLILHITFIGEIIFALLVVLDIINLA